MCFPRALCLARSTLIRIFPFRRDAWEKEALPISLQAMLGEELESLFQFVDIRDNSFNDHTIIPGKLLQPVCTLPAGLEAQPALRGIGLWHRNDLDLYLVFEAPQLCLDHLTDVLKQYDLPIFQCHELLWQGSSIPPVYGRGIAKIGNPR